MCINKKLIKLEVLVKEYFELMIQALESSIKFNVLAHFEYGLRIIDISVVEFDNLASIFLNKIAELIVKKEMAFEVNTKSMYKYKKENLYSYMIEKYIKKGGRLFTLGSDAHNIKEYAYKCCKHIGIDSYNKGIDLYNPVIAFVAVFNLKPFFCR